MSTPDSGKSLLTFPCVFPIKVVGQSGVDFEAHVLAIVRRHVPDLKETAVGRRPSKAGRFTSLTVTVNAESQTQLDAIYRELSASPDVIMAL